jgi:hypothetical protein
MCLIILVALLGPRVGIILYWLGWPARWEVAFDSFIVPFIGFLLLPWVTLTWLVVAPTGVEGFDYVLLGLAGMLDLVSLTSGGRMYSRRGASPTPSY